MFGQQLGYPDQTALLLAACCATWFFITSIISVIGIDHYFGRRTLTIFGASGMCACMMVLCGMSYLSTQSSHHAMSAFLFLYVAFFSIGWQGMSWLWAVELIPLNIRGPANALSTAASWLSNFCVVITCPIMFTNVSLHLMKPHLKGFWLTLTDYVQNVRSIHGLLRSHGTHHILLLPRNWIEKPRRDRYDLRERYHTRKPLVFRRQGFQAGAEMVRCRRGEDGSILE
jgi:hypothetical protein